MAKNEGRTPGISVEGLLARDEIARYARTISRPLVVKVASASVAQLRRKAAEDEFFAPSADDAAALCAARLEELESRRLRPVLNATGVVLNAALGRSPLRSAAWDAARGANIGYSNFEYDLSGGVRRRRGGIVPELVSVLTGAESALVVNNGSAAILLSLVALGAGREVIVSRGDAVQVGGFRVPEIVAMAGARMKEVGTANVTTVEDYARAVGPDTAAVLLVNASNFALRGFARKPGARAIAEALPPGTPIIVDQGSGATVESRLGESSALRALSSGAGLVCFSGDKVLGGPQCGVVAGKAELVSRIAKHPLLRVFRPGKTVLTLLEATLVERLGTGGADEASKSAFDKAAETADHEALQELKAYGRKILKRLRTEGAAIEASRASLGSGTSPDEFIDSWAISLECGASAEALKKELRRGSLPIIPRIEKDRVLLDLLTLAGEDPKAVAEAVDEAVERFRAAGGGA